jgi:hypothetical protein
MDLRRPLPSVLLGLALAAPTTAQDGLEYELPPGTRVRVTVEDSRVEGYLSGREGNGLRLRLPHQNPLVPDLIVPVSAVTRVEVHVGERRHTKTGAIVGALVMGLVGIWEPVSSAPGCGQGSAPSCSRADAVIGGLVGDAAVGALVGRAIKTERWAPVPRDALVLAPPTPDEIRQAPGGPGVPAGLPSCARASVRF